MRILTDGQESLLKDARSLLNDLRVSLVNFGAATEDHETLGQSIRQLDELFLVVVVGEFNSGKSAFINALLGQPILKEGVTPTTTQINVLRYGDTLERSVDSESLHTLSAPVRLLAELNIVDTPGTNAIIREHELITTQFVPRADLVLFVTSADRPFTESERAFLETIRNWGKKVVIVLNKIDLFQSAEDLNQVVAFIAENSHNLFGLTPEIFPVSARLVLRAKQGEPALWDASHFSPLEAYIQTTLDEKGRLRLKFMNPMGVAEHLVQKYLGVEGANPRVARLGGKSWERAKTRVKKAVEKIARELVELYALRRVLPGHHFSPPDPVFREFEATFAYEETPDQLQAVADVLADMTSEKPMDRLICGDVGYGKTEVAVRAAFKAAMDGKQVAVLVPTTVLAEQHYETFKSRLAHFPLEVRALSRFRGAAEQKRILAEVAQGKVDILIGTHRLLSKDVAFRDLGLAIVDEEQRFGVRQKERLKEWRRTVDCLTLTATPIPRTLQLSLTGLRELSLINTPPENRRAIRTYVCLPETAVIQSAIRRELDRGGQVFFVHNRVRSLATWTRHVREMVPEARVAMAHGQMAEKELEQVMVRFWRREVDVLVCTAIIEAGLDIPAANTIIINRAHTMGLAQLYQLRGRVGRSQAQAYAYLLVPDEAALTREAQKRLKALMEFTELGSGFRIAMHDLQIRGAGNLLGQAQSGHLLEVGYELYLQLLESAIREYKGEPVEEAAPDPEIHLPLAAYLPEDYVPDVQQRLALYRRLSGRLTPDMVRELEEEFLDRFGPLPPEGRNLLEVVRAKHRLRELGVKRLDIQESFAVLQFAHPERLDLPRLLDSLKRRPGTFRLTPDQNLRIRLAETGPVLGRLQNCLKEVETFVKAEGEDKIYDQN